jgi:hypothetical protein
MCVGVVLVEVEPRRVVRRNRDNATEDVRGEVPQPLACLLLDVTNLYIHSPLPLAGLILLLFLLAHMSTLCRGILLITS